MASLDAALGFHVPSLVAWTAQYPTLVTGLVIAYGSFVQQVFFLPFVFACVSSRERLWTYVLSYQIAWTLAIVCLAIWPAQCAFVFLNYQQDPHLVSATTLMPDLLGARAHTLGTIVLGQTNGLITFPSFHTMLGILMIWTGLEKQWLGCWLIPLNVGLIAGTLLLGPHYAVDLLASLVLMPLIIWLARWLTRRALAGVYSPTVDTASTSPAANAPGQVMTTASRW